MSVKSLVKVGNGVESSGDEIGDQVLSIEMKDEDSDDSIDSNVNGGSWRKYRKNCWSLFCTQLITFTLSQFARMTRPWMSNNSCYTPPTIKFSVNESHDDGVIMSFGVRGSTFLIGDSNGHITAYDTGLLLKTRQYTTGLRRPPVRHLITNMLNNGFIAITSWTIMEFKYEELEPKSKYTADHKMITVLKNSLPILIIDEKSTVFELVIDDTDGVWLNHMYTIPFRIQKAIDLKLCDFLTNKMRLAFIYEGNFAAILDLNVNNVADLAYYKRKRFEVDDFVGAKFAIYENNLFYAEVLGQIYNEGESEINIESLNHFWQDRPPIKLLIKSGLLRHFTILENLLVAFTSSDDIEIFDALDFTKKYHIRSAYDITKAFLINSQMVLGLTNKKLVSFRLYNSTEVRCCLHCSRKISEDNHFVKICRHFLP